MLRALRSMHLRFARDVSTDVKAPVHVLYYRIASPGVVEIVRILHERMEPGGHVRGRKK